MRLLVLLLLAAAASPCETIRVDLEVVKPEVIQQRLEAIRLDAAARRETLEAFYREAGCEGDRISSQKVPLSKEANLLCSLAAEAADARTIVVGAHFDFVPRGIGAADNWSGAALLPSLYQSLAKKPRRHRFVFVNFAAEERGLYGSREYVRKLGKEGRATVAAMVNIDTVGLSAPTIWASRSDRILTAAYVRIAQALGQKPAGVNVERVGDDDSHPFKDAKIPVISFHSVTQQNLGILHSIDDNLKAIDAQHYYDTYRLASLYLAYIDSVLD